MPRWLATLIVLGVIVGGGILALVLIAPLIVNQIMQLACRHRITSMSCVIAFYRK